MANTLLSHKQNTHADMTQAPAIDSIIANVIQIQDDFNESIASLPPLGDHDDKFSEPERGSLTNLDFLKNFTFRSDYNVKSDTIGDSNNPTALSIIEDSDFSAIEGVGDEASITTPAPITPTVRSALVVAAAAAAAAAGAAAGAAASSSSSSSGTALLA